MHMADVHKNMNTAKNDGNHERRKTSMKERYETPEMEIVEFETEDIITTSNVQDENALPEVGI